MTIHANRPDAPIAWPKYPNSRLNTVVDYNNVGADIMNAETRVMAQQAFCSRGTTSGGYSHFCNDLFPVPLTHTLKIKFFARKYLQLESE